MGSLPREITDRILDYLYGDRKSLFQCRAVCWQWLHGANYHLFSYLAITPKIRSTHDLSELFAKHSSTISPCVRRLLVAGESYDGDLDFAHQTAATLLRVRLFPALRELIVKTIRNPSFPEMTHINRNIVSLKSVVKTMTTSPTSPSIPLQHLSLLEIPIVAQQNIIRWISTSHLRTIDIDASAVVAELLCGLGQTLQNLKLKFSQDECSVDFLASCGFNFNSNRQTDDAAGSALSGFLPNLVALELQWQNTITKPLRIIEVMRNWLLSRECLRHLLISGSEAEDDTVQVESVSILSSPAYLELQYLSLNCGGAIQDYVTSWIPTLHLTLVEIPCNQGSAAFLRKLGPSLQHLKLMLFGEQDDADFLRGGGLIHNIKLRTIGMELFGLSGEDVRNTTAILRTISSPFLNKVVFRGLGYMLPEVFAEMETNDLQRLATSFIDSSLSVGDPKVILQILCFWTKHPEAEQVKIYQNLRNIFHSLDIAGRLKVQQTPTIHVPFNPFINPFTIDPSLV